MSIRRMKQGLTLLALVPALLAITPVQAQVTPDSLKLAEQLTTEAIERIEQQVGANAGGTEVLRAQLGTIKRAGRQVEATLIQTSPDMVRGRALYIREKSAPSEEPQVVVGTFTDPMDELLGASLIPVPDALRAQFTPAVLPAGVGLAVVSLTDDGPGARAGLKRYDILLTLAAKPLTNAEDLTKTLNETSEKAVELTLLRARKPITLKVRPIKRVTIGPVEEEKKEYFLGISLSPLEEALRAQLELPGNGGMLVNYLIPGSPAEKAGINVHDLLIKVDGTSIDSPETLVTKVQEAQENPVKLELLRAGGERVALTVKPAIRTVPVEAGNSEKVRLLVQPSARLFQAVGAGNFGDDIHVTLDQEGGISKVVRGQLQSPALKGQDVGLQRLENIEAQLLETQRLLEKLTREIAANRERKP